MQSDDSSGHEQDGPSRKRNKRSSRACDACRRGKVRCDASIEGEVCSICRIKSIPCTFIETSKRRAPPKGYIESLETRINNLESLLHKVAPGLIDSLDSGGLDDLGLAPDDGQAGPSGPSPTLYPGGRIGNALSQSTSGSKKAPLNSSKKVASNARPSFSPSRSGGVEGLTDAISDMTVEGRYFGESSTMRMLAQLQGSGSDGTAPPTLQTLLPNQAASSLNDERRNDSPHQPRANIPTPSLAPKTPEDDMHTQSGSRSSNRAERSYAEARMESDHAFRTRLRFPVPPVEKCRPLIDLYFQHVQPIFPILHRPSFERAFQEFIPNDQLRRNEAFATLVFAVLALGSRFSTDPIVMSDFDLMVDGKELPTSKQRYAAGYALAICAFYVSPRWSSQVSLWTTQAALLSAIWHWGSSPPLLSWMTVSSAIRSAIDVGMHRNKTRRWTCDHLTDQMRKRTMWTLITLDRTLASQLGRNVTLQEGDHDLDLPWEISDGELEAVAAATPLAQSAPVISLSATPSEPHAVNNVTFLRQSALLSIIQTKALRTIYAPRIDTPKAYAATRWEERVISELDHSLHRWQHSLPPICQWDDKRPLVTEEERFSALRSALLHVDFYSTQILIHRQFVAASRQKLITWPSATICQNAARSMCHTLCYLLRKDLLQWSWVHAPLNATNTATLLLVTLAEEERAGQEHKQSTIDDIQRCIDLMVSMSDSSYIAYKSVMGLRDLCRLYRGARTLKFDDPSERRRRDVSPANRPIKVEPSPDHSDLLTSPQYALQTGLYQGFGPKSDVPVDIKPYALLPEPLASYSNPQSQTEAQACQSSLWQAMAGGPGTLSQADLSAINVGNEQLLRHAGQYANNPPAPAQSLSTPYKSSASTTPEFFQFSPTKATSKPSTPRRPGGSNPGSQAMIVPHSLNDAQSQTAQRDNKFPSSLSVAPSHVQDPPPVFSNQMPQSSPLTAFHWEDYLPGLPNLPVPQHAWPMLDPRFAQQQMPLLQPQNSKQESSSQNHTAFAAGLPAPSIFDFSNSMQFLPSVVPQDPYSAYVTLPHQQIHSLSQSRDQSQYTAGQYR